MLPIAAVLVLIFVTLVIFYPQALMIDTIWHRQRSAERVRALANKVIRNPHDDASLRELILIAQSNYRFERYFAIGTLGNLGDKAEAALPTIIDGLSSSDPYTRNSSALALSNMGKTAAPAKAELIRMLKHYPTESSSTWAAESLGNIGDPSPEVLDALRVAARTGTVGRVHEAYQKLTGHRMDEIHN